MKKLLFVIFSLTLALIMLVACGGTETADSECAHTCEEWDEVVEADCENTGKRIGTCTACGEHFEEIIPITHDIVEAEACEPSCIFVGWESFEYCTRCSYSTYKELPPNGHTEQTIPAVAPQLGVDGSTEGKICTTCNVYTVRPVKIPMLVELSVSVGSTEAGSVSFESKVVGKGASVTVEAQANDGYRFFGWFDGRTLVSESQIYTFNMPDANYTLVARFEKGDYEKAPLPLWSGGYASDFSGGSGSANDPYIIATAEDLYRLSGVINGNMNNQYYNLHYKLVADIDLGGKPWIPIGDGRYGALNTHFCGTFDGAGHVIYGLSFDGSGLNYSNIEYFGLFGLVYGATIKNLGVVIDTTFEYQDNFGGLVGKAENKTLIENCFVTGDIVHIGPNKPGYTYYKYCGGLVGVLKDSTVSNCYFSGTVTATTTLREAYVYAGGIVASASNSKIKNSYASGKVEARVNDKMCVVYSGGILGSGNSTTVVGCLSNVEAYSSSDIVINTRSHCGSIAGSGSVSKSYCVLGLERGADKSTVKTCTNAELKSSSFYTETLGWDSSAWCTKQINFEEGKMPTQTVYSPVGKNYVQLDVIHTEGGSVNAEIVLLEEYAKVILVATPDSGYTFLGWFDGENCVSADMTFVYATDVQKVLEARFSDQ